MTTYRFIGAAPDVDPISNTIVHPGDVWNFGEEPTFGRWELIARDAEKPSEATDGTPPTQSHQDEGENAATDASGSSSTQES